MEEGSERGEGGGGSGVNWRKLSGKKGEKRKTYKKKGKGRGNGVCVGERGGD